MPLANQLITRPFQFPSACFLFCIYSCDWLFSSSVHNFSFHSFSLLLRITLLPKMDSPQNGDTLLSWTPYYPGWGHNTVDQLAIAKTSGKLGPNQYRKGTWDRLEGQDSSEEKQKYHTTTIAAYSTWLHKQPQRCNATFLFARSIALSLQTIPVPLRALIPTQLPTRFGNGHSH